MILQTPAQRECYEEYRRKVELAHKWFLAAELREVRAEGYVEGFAEGFRQGFELGFESGRLDDMKKSLNRQVKLLRDLLHQTATTDSNRLALQLSALERLRDELKGRLQPPA